MAPSLTIWPKAVLVFQSFSGAGTDSICFATLKSSAPGNSSSAIVSHQYYFISLISVLLAQTLNSCFPASHYFLNIAQTERYYRDCLSSVFRHNPEYVLPEFSCRQEINLFRCAEQLLQHQVLLSGKHNIFLYAKVI